MQMTDEDLLALAKKDKIQAIKEYQESTGADLADAKNYIDNLLANDNTELSETTNSFQTQPIPNDKKNSKPSKGNKIICIIIGIALILVGVIWGISDGVSSASRVSNNKTTTQYSTYNQTTETTTTATTTTEATTAKEIKFPTIDEYLEKLSENILPNTDLQRTNYYSDNYVLITWSVKYNDVENFKYDLMLFLNEDKTISGCSIMTIKEKFINNYTQLLSSEQQYDVMVEMSAPAYLLACMHNNVDCNNDEYSELLNKKILEDVYSSSKKYDNDIFDCDFSISVADYGVTTYLDYGADKHE
jgi:hypothetical protein